jgi:hypothetical protein
MILRLRCVTLVLKEWNSAERLRPAELIPTVEVSDTTGDEKRT